MNRWLRFHILCTIFLTATLLTSCRSEPTEPLKKSLETKSLFRQAAAQTPKRRASLTRKQRRQREANQLSQQLNQALGSDEVSKARKLLRRLLRSYKDTHSARWAYYNYAQYLYRKGKKDDAVKAFLQITRMFPGKSVANSATYRIRSITGEYLYMYVRRTYSPGDKIRVSVSSRNLKQLKMQLWQVDLLNYVKAGHNPHYPNLYKMKGRRLIKRWTETPQVPSWVRRYRRYRRRPHSYQSYTAVEVPVSKAGTYLLFVNGKYTSTGALILVSRYGMLVKRSPKQLLVFVTHRNRAEVGRGIQISALYNGKVVASGQTNDKGVFSTRIDKGMGYQAVVVGQVRGETVIADAYQWRRQGNTAIAMTYTDRPVYRPNQKVSFKVIARRKHSDQAEERYTYQPGETVHVRIRAPRGGIIYNQKLKTNDFGTAQGHVMLDSGAALGRYSIYVVYSGRTSYSYFHVEEYKKPEYQVTVDPYRKHVVGGETMKVKIKARYYFGQPVADAQVMYRVYRRNVYRMRFFCGLHRWYYNPYRRGYYSYYRGSQVKAGQGKLNPKGELVISIPTEKANADQSYTVMAYVTDKSRRQIQGSGRFQVTRGAFYLRLNTDKYAYSPGETVYTRVIAKSHDNKPVAVRVDLQVKVRKYDNRRWTQRVLYKKSLQTGANGEAVYKWVPDMQGYFQIEAVAQDSKGNKIQTTRWLWYVGNNYSSVYRYSGLQLTLDKDSYQVGDTARIIVTTGYKDSYALVTYEADQIYDYQVVKFHGSALTMTRKLTQRDVPNTYVNISAIYKNSYVSRSKQIVIPPVEQFVKVNVRPHKKSYEPGEMGTFDIHLVDAKGRPLRGEVSVGVVDEAVYAIQPDRTPDIRKHFYGLRPLRVTTYHSLYFWSRSSGGVVNAAQAASRTISANDAAPAAPAREAAGRRARRGPSKKSRRDNGRLVEAKLRSKFADTAYWSPTVVTDTQGKAQISFKMPDNLTTWRLTARVVTRDTKVGMGKGVTMTQKDLLVRLQTPRTMTEKDKVTISGIVHNYLPRKKRVVVDFFAKGAKILGRRKYTVWVPAGGEKRIDFQVRALGPHTSRLRVRARTNEKSDAMQLDIPVLPFGAKQVAAKAGKVDTSKRLVMEIPRTAALKSAQLKLVLSPSLAATMLDALEYLVGYPYGCVEQTMSRLLPNLYVAQTLQKLGLENKKLQKELPKMVRKGVNRLLDLQQSNGGWGWWKHGQSHPFMTAYAMFGLTLAQRSDFKVEPYKLRRGVSRLRYMIQQELKRKDKKVRPDTLVYMLHTLSYHQRPSKEVITFLHNHHEKLSDYGRALFYLILRRMKDEQAARKVMGILVDRVKVSSTMAHWGGKTWRYRWTDNNIETTAYVMKALVMENPRHPLLPKVINYLLSSRQGNRWTSTKDTAAVVYAFADYLKASGELQSNYRFQVKLNGKLIKQASITRENLASFRGILTLDGRHLKHGDNRLEISKQGKGSLYYSTYLLYYNRASRLKPTSSGLRVRRKYYVVQWDKNKYNRPIKKRFLFKGGSLKSGQTLEVEVSVTAPKRYQYLMVEDYIPAGMEIVKQTNRYLYYGGYSGWRRYYWSYGGHREARDAKMVFFQTHVPAGKHRFTYQLRAETPGTFRTLPTYAELMYHPEVTGTSSDRTFRIRD